MTLTNYSMNFSSTSVLSEGKKVKPNLSVPLQIRLHIEDYLEMAGGDKSLAKIYAKRDDKGAVDKTERVVTKLMKVNRLPYNVGIHPKYKYTKNGSAHFSVTVEGGERKFLQSLLDKKPRLLESLKMD